MGLRFRKSFKIMPGVRVSLSGKSAGIRIGGKHAGVSVNSKRGVRASASLPGTGLSYSTKLGSSSKRKSSRKFKVPSQQEASTPLVYAEPEKVSYFDFDWSSPGFLLIGLAAIFAVIALFVVLYNNFGAELALLIILGLAVLVGIGAMVLSLVLAKPIISEPDNSIETVPNTTDEKASVSETTSDQLIPSVYKFTLIGNESEERQQALRELKIKLWVEGTKAKLELVLDEESKSGIVKLGETELGQIGPQDFEWINGNNEAITQLSNVQVFGGATDVNNVPRPFVVEISAEVLSLTPAPSFSPLTLPPVKTYHRCNGDAVCYVSKSKKVHLGFCPSVNIDNCKPMLVEEAFELDYDFCSKCF